jgi:NhaP-type Na+/H+ or K+/H+ antiporter
MEASDGAARCAINDLAVARARQRTVSRTRPTAATAAKPQSVAMDALWFVLVGTLLLVAALFGRLLVRWPVSLATVFLATGFLLGPAVFGVVELHPLRDLVWFESALEIAVLVASFAAGLGVRVPLGDRRWALPLRLSTVSMGVTIAGVAFAAVALFGFEWGIAALLGVALAPTDAVPAADVPLRPEGGEARFALAGEGGLTTALAYPLALLVLGAIGLHDLGPLGLHWLTVDLAWGAVGGLAVGYLVGGGVARAVRWLRRGRGSAFVRDEFLLLGTIALSYGVASAANALGLLAVCAAGFALRRAEDRRDPAGAPGLAPALAPLARFVESAVALAVGAAISTGYWSMTGIFLAGLLFFAIRPAAVWLGVARELDDPAARRRIAWFGFRGIACAYFAVVVAGHEIPYDAAIELLSCVFTVIAASLLCHGAPVRLLGGSGRAAARPPDAAPVSDKP